MSKVGLISRRIICFLLILVSFFALRNGIGCACDNVQTLSFTSSNSKVACAQNYSKTSENYSENSFFATPKNISNSKIAGKVGCENIFKKIINWIFKKPEADEAEHNPVSVYVGGIPLGFTLECDGVVVVGLSEVQTEKGTFNPASKANIMAGDVLLTLDGQKISSAEKIDEILNRPDYAGQELPLELSRKGQVLKSAISPALDLSTQKYKLGLWIRDNAAGVGTLSFVRCDNLRFGALGHPVCDVDTGAIMPISSGGIYMCDIVGVAKGERGLPGELKGLFLRNGEKIGDLDNNTNFGVFGTIPENCESLNLGEKVQTASPSEVRVGRATVRCTTLGDTPSDYDIEIIKVNRSNPSGQKNMVVSITSPELISQTGGIVQGMSGSPILQNGKLIGVITHVFVSDPTKGYATFINNMINS